MFRHDDVNCYCLQNKGGIVYDLPEKLYTTPGSNHERGKQIENSTPHGKETFNNAMIIVE